MAYFITFSTYGTWLHGTDKGLGSVDDEHNSYGTRFLEADREREAEARSGITQEPYILDEPRRRVVRDALVELAAEKGWKLWAVHVRSNHVHAVVTAAGEPGRLSTNMKARASQKLNAAGYESAERRRWTRHGSTKYLFDEGAVESAVRYTLEGQGTAMAFYDGCSKDPRTE